MAAANAFAALGSEARLSILHALVRAGSDGLSVGALQQRTGIAGSTLSHHIRALVQADILQQERQGRSLVCRAQFRWIEVLAGFLLRECCVDATAETSQTLEGSLL